LHRTPGQAELVVDRVAEGVVVGVAAGDVERQLISAGDAAQDRHVQFEVDLVQRVLAGGGGGGKAGVQRRLVEGVGDEHALFLAVLHAHGQAQRTGRELDHGARQVGEVGGG